MKLNPLYTKKFIKKTECRNTNGKLEKKNKNQVFILIFLVCVINVSTT